METYVSEYGIVNNVASNKLDRISDYFRLINQVDATRKLSTSSTGHKFAKNQWMISWWLYDKVLDPNNGFFQNDTIIIEASLEVYVETKTETIV